MSDAAWAHGLMQGNVDVPRDWGATNGSDARVRFDVYRNNVWTSWVQALVETYPVLHRVMGDEAFRDMALLFVGEQPPSDVVLAHYGQGVAEFLQRLMLGSSANAAKSAAWWPDLARLEYARVSSFHAADATALSTLMLEDGLRQAQGLHDVVFTFQPCVQVVHSQWSVSRVWMAYQQDTVTRAVACQPAPESVLICREGWDVVMVRLTLASGRFLDRLRKGETLGEAAHAAMGEDALFDLSATLALLLRYGCLSQAHLLAVCQMP